MNRYKSVLLISISFAFLAGIASLLIDGPVEINNISLQTLANITSIITSIILFGASIALYQRFNGSQTVIDKQTEKTIEFLSYVSSLGFLFELYSQNNESHALYLADISNYRDQLLDIKHKYDLENISYKDAFNSSVFELFGKFDTYSLDPYLPSLIAKSISKNMRIHVAQAVEESHVNLVVLKIRGAQKNRNYEIGIDEITYYDSINREQFSIEDFFVNLETIYSDAYYWLEHNNPVIAKSINLIPLK